jgi:hypothetical protein
MNVLFFIIYFIALFYIVRKLTIQILTNYFNKKIREKELLIANENKIINNDKIILKGTIERNFEIKKDIMNFNANQKLSAKYNKNVYRGLNGRYTSFKK